METITKEKIADMLKSKIGLSRVLCEEIVHNIFNEIYEIIKTEKKLTLVNFGKFSIFDKNPRPGMNFSTKERVTVPAKRVVRFLAADHLKKMINSYGK